MAWGRRRRGAAATVGIEVEELEVEEED